MIVRLFFLCMLLFVSACQTQTKLEDLSDVVNPQDVPTVNPGDTRLATAQRNYNKWCAHCHGWGGDGQPISTIENAEALGYHTVPRHDEHGHTWKHPDALLFAVIKYGISSPLDLYPMSPYEENLTDAEIWAIIDYIKRWWTDDQRRHQSNLTKQFAENNPYWSADELEGEPNNTP